MEIEIIFYIIDSSESILTWFFKKDSTKYILYIYVVWIWIFQMDSENIFST